MSTIARLFVEYGADTTKLKSGVRSAGEEVRKSQKNLERVSRDMSQMGMNLTKTVTLPIVGIGVASIKSSIDFESAFAGVRKTVTATEPELAKLRTGIIAMANELPASREEIAGVAEAAGQLGIKTDSILGFSRVMIDLGQTTNLSAAEAATSLARLANITQMPQDQFDELGSTVVALGNNLATTEAEIVEMGLRLAGAGAQVGMTEAQILGMAGALSSVGVRAEAGGTAFSRVMLEMQAEVMSGGERLAGFAQVAGMSADKFAAAFKTDAAGAITAFVEGLGRIGDAGGNVAGVLDVLELGEMRVRDALLRTAGAGEQMATAIDLGTDAWGENTALAAEAEQRYATMQSQLSTVWGRITDVARQLGEALGPALQDTVAAAGPLIAGLTWLVDVFAALPAPAQTFIIALAGVAAMAGPVLVAAGAIGMALASLSIAGGPIFITIAAIAALITVGVTLARNWDQVAGSLGRTWRNIGRFAADTWGAIIRFFQTLPAKAAQVGRDIASGMANGIKSKVAEVVDAAKNMALAPIRKAKQILGISSPSKAWYKVGRDSGAGLVGGLDDSVRDVLSASGDLGRAAVAGYDRAAAAVVKFDDAVAGLREQMAAAAATELRDQITTVDAGLLPAYDAATAALAEMRGQMSGLQDQLAEEVAILDDLEQALAGATSEWEAQKDVLAAIDVRLDAATGSLSAAKDEVRAIESALRDAQEQLRFFTSAPLEGTGAFADELFALEQQAKGLQLELVDAQLAGASEEQLAGIREQLERVRLEAEQTRLTRDLELDPLRRQLDDVADSSRELTFTEAMEGALAAAASIAELSGQLDGANVRVGEQQAAVDLLKASYDAQKEAVDQAAGAVEAAQEAYDAQKQIVDDIKGAIDQMNGAIGNLEEAITSGVDLIAAKFGEMEDALAEAAGGMGDLFDGLGDDVGELEGQWSRSVANMSSSWAGFLDVVDSTGAIRTPAPATGAGGFFDVPSSPSAPQPTTTTQPGHFPGGGPQMAHGGDVTESGMFEVHQREKVFLPAGTAVRPNDKIGGGGDIGPIQVVVDGRVIAEITRDELKRYARVNGGTAGIP